VELEFFTRVIALARRHDILVIHDLAYADIVFDGWKAPSIMQVPAAKDVAVEFFTLSKSYNMAGWRIGFMVGNPELVNALARIKSYHDYGTFTPLQVAAIAHLVGDGLSKILKTIQGADLDVRVLVGHWVRAAPHPCDGLFYRLDLPDPVTRDKLLGLRKRPVHHTALGAAEAHAFAEAARLEAVARKHDASFDQLVVVVGHRIEQLGARGHAGFTVWGCFNNYHHLHFLVSCWGLPRPGHRGGAARRCVRFSWQRTSDA
jgi:DNA-binding transcriptional MocR family regulator